MTPPPPAPVYCDYNAGAPLRPEAREAMIAALDGAANASSIHVPGRRARARLEEAREVIAGAVGAAGEHVAFTSGATEAAHLALEGARGVARSVLVSAIEHDAVFEHAKQLYDEHAVIPVTQDGVLDLAALRHLLSCATRPALVALMAANNETGVVQPLREAALLVREAGGLLLVDGAQALGRLPLDMGTLDASYLLLSSAKIGGPQGAGALVLAPGAPFRASRRGGGQESGRRAGTENVAAIAGFAAAVRVGVGEREAEQTRLGGLRARFEASLPEGVVVAGAGAARLANTSLLVLPHQRGETAAIALDLEGVCVSAGSACSSGKTHESRVLAAMMFDAEARQRGVRFSFGWASSEVDVTRTQAALAKLALAWKEAA